MIDEFEEREYQTQIEEMRLKLSRAMGQLAKFSGMQSDYETRIASLQVSEGIARRERDAFAAEMAALGQQMTEKGRVVAAAMAGTSQLKTQQIATEMLNQELVNGLDRAMGLLRKYVPQGVQESNITELRELIATAKEQKEAPRPQIKPETSRQPIPQQPIQPVRK